MDELSRFERELGAGAQARAGKCLEASDLIELAEKGARARDYRRSMSHVSACARCRRAFKEVVSVEARRREIRRSIAPRPFPLWAFGAAAAIMVAIVVPVALNALRTQDSAVAEKSVPAPAPQELPRMNDSTPPGQPDTRVAEATVSPRPDKASKPKIVKRRASPPREEMERREVPEPHPSRALVAESEPGWTYGGLSGEVLAQNLEVGEVIAGNVVQGEVVGGPERPTPPPTMASE